MLAREYWGQGYMSEALSGFLRHLWPERPSREKICNYPMSRDEVNGDTPLKKVIADVDPRNTACITLLEKFGFIETERRERTFEINGVWCDSVYFTLLQEPEKRSDLSQVER